MAAGSGASRSRTTISAAGCSRTDRCWRPRPIRIARRRCLRGKFLLNNILGLPAPPPPPGVDTNLAETKPDAPPLTIRERLAQHRTNPSCASCHSVIDPLGFALEQFDAIGAWRTRRRIGPARRCARDDAGRDDLEGLPGCERGCSRSRSSFREPSPRSCSPMRLAGGSSTTIGPAVRTIVRDAAAQDYRWSSLILGIVKSPAFLMRGDESKETTNDVSHRTVVATPHGAPRAGRDVALPLLEAMLPASSPRASAAATSRPPLPGLLCAQRHGHGVLDAEG